MSESVGFADAAPELADRLPPSGSVFAISIEASAAAAISDETVVEAAERVAACAEMNAAALDAHGTFPSADIHALHEAGLLTAPLPRSLNGADLCEPGRVASLREVLSTIGRGSLALGRIYEGHVNALALVLRYGAPAVVERLASDARHGHVFGVWNTEPEPGGLAIAPGEKGHRLSGAKSFASGAGHVTRPLVTALMPDGRRLMLVVPLNAHERADLSAWRAHGMKATATGSVDFSGITVSADAVIGEADDYFRQPFFLAGAWRFLAVQLGGIEGVFEAHRTHLRRTGRGGDPHQAARLALSATAVETARLFVARAARLAVAESADAGQVVAYVNLARGAVERAGLDVIELAQRSIGLAGFLEGHPLERRMRDLATYLRQPAPDYALTGAAEHILAVPDPAHRLWREGV